MASLRLLLLLLAELAHEADGVLVLPQLLVRARRRDGDGEGGGPEGLGRDGVVAVAVPGPFRSSSSRSSRSLPAIAVRQRHVYNVPPLRRDGKQWRCNGLREGSRGRLRSCRGARHEGRPRADVDVRRPRREPRARRSTRVARGGGRGRRGRLPAGAVPLAVLLPEGGRARSSTSPRPCPARAPRRWAAAAKQAGVVVVAPIFERRAAGLYHNSAAIIDADGEVARPLPQDAHPRRPAFYEKFYFTPGDLGFRAFDTRTGRIGTLICWDQWYPEGARLTALRGAAVLFYPTAIGWHPHEKARVRRRAARRLADDPARHAIANGVYVAVVNRVGHERPPEGGPGLEFWGSSFVADPFGVVIAEASTDREEILVAEVDLARIEEVRRNWPFLRDRRIDAYARHRAALPRLSRVRRAPPAAAFRMPAEWEPHEATWLAWPHKPLRLAGQVRAHPLGLRRDRAQARARRDACASWCRRPRARGAGAAGAGRAWASTSARVEFFRFPTDRGWTRDFGPDLREATTRPAARSRSRASASTAGPSTRTGRRTTACPSARRERCGCRCGPSCTRAGRSCSRAAASTSTAAARCSPPRSACSTRSCRCATPASARDGLEARACATRSARRNVIWLGTGIAGDDTHGHVDDLCRFVSPRTVVLCREKDPRDANYRPLEENRERLQGARLEDGARARGGGAAHARAAVLRRPAPARELRELLHRQRGRAGADLQRSRGPRGAGHPGRAVPRPPGGRHPRASTWCGAWARCTA